MLQISQEAALMKGKALKHHLITAINAQSLGQSEVNSMVTKVAADNMQNQ